MTINENSSVTTHPKKSA